MAGDPRERRLVALLLILSITTGLVDAVSVLGLGRVFTANMTGNIVFLGFALAGIAGFSWPICVTALAAFAAGAATAARICSAHEGRPRHHWLRAIACIEALLLWAAAACAFAPPGLSTTLIMVALTAIAMGTRNSTVRQLKVADLTTTVLTLTITGLAADSPLAGGSNTNLSRRILAVAAILLGAFIGAWMWSVWSIAPPLILAGVIILVATLLLVHEEEIVR